MSKNELIAQVRKRTYAARAIHDSQWTSQANIALRKFIYFAMVPLRMGDSLLWNWFAGMCLGALIGMFMHFGFLRILVSDGFSFVLIQTLCSLIAVFLVTSRKRYLDTSDIPMLTHFSTLPWSNSKLVMHYLAGRFARSGPLLSYWLVSGLFLQHQSFEELNPTLASSMVASIAVYLLVFVVSVFFSTIDFVFTWQVNWLVHRARRGIFAAAVAILFVVATYDNNEKMLAPAAILLVPFAWPYGILWMSLNGAGIYLVLSTSIGVSLFIVCLFLISVQRLYSRLPIVEFLEHGPTRCSAIPLSEKKRFIEYQLLYQLEEQSPILETSVNAAIDACVASGQERYETHQFRNRFAYSEDYWRRQGPLKSIVYRFLSDREMHVVALVETLKHGEDFRRRWLRLGSHNVLCVLLLLFSPWITSLTGLIRIDLLMPMIVLLPTFSFLRKIVGHNHLATVRSLPYATKAIVWALVKRTWIESVLLWPIAAGSFAFALYLNDTSPIEIARFVWIATVLLFAAPMCIVSFGLHDATRQEFFHRSSVYFAFLFFGLIAIGLLGGFCMITGGLLLSMMGSMLAMSASYGFSTLMLWAYHRAAIDFL